ncbi:ABC transporter permease [Acrocarpospora catenulata]|uniref:ABC transporter permease n=1 Tax=Acrocarpospora catenulata TaxID=2836182 RepID=UPI001BDB2A2D|nr:ABC transporter permease [Acrocarpospora catenulata]
MGAPARYVAGRLAQGAVVIWAAFTVTFVILYLLPSDPVSIMLSQGGDSTGVSEEAESRLRAEFGLDQPVLVQYATALWRALHGDFGDSITLGGAVIGHILQALPQTVLLTAVTAVIAVAGGVGLAVAASATRSRTLRRVLTNLPSVAVSLPSFWVGMVLIQLFSFRLHLFPALGNGGFATLVLPAVTLAVPTGAVVAQVLYNNLSGALRQAFVEVLRAKGLSERRILLGHALRVAVLPALTLVGMNIAAMLAGAIVIETVFGRSGLGRLTEAAVSEQDIPLVQGVVVVSAAVFVLVNLVVDLLYPLVDPRISHRATAAS